MPKLECRFRPLGRKSGGGYPRQAVHEGGERNFDNALLAQSAEHSHGKAGVVGSIPTEGSPPLHLGGGRSRAVRRGDQETQWRFVGRRSRSTSCSQRKDDPTSPTQ